MQARTFVLLVFVVVLTHAPVAARPPAVDAEIAIYGGTSAGIIAAVQAARLGKDVVLIEPGRHLGGLTSGGLGATDIGNKGAIGGLAREFYRRVARRYAADAAWKFQSRESYRSRRRSAGETTMWTFEPHVAEAIFERLLAESGVEVLRGERLELAVSRDGRSRGVDVDKGRIVAIRMESDRVVRAKVYLDCTYEGDLMARAGVSYHVGREGNDVYGETLNGVQTRNARYHQFQHPVDPYVAPGDPASGLLPGVHGDPPGREGAGDHRVQAYNFRMCLTDAPANRVEIAKPKDYDPRRYELLLRYFEAGFRRVPWSLTPMPNRKTDINNNHGFSTDHIGGNYDYPDGEYAAREAIFADHVAYQLGLVWCLANDPRVPPAVRREVGRWGLCKDEFRDSGGWPFQLYVREARRMIGAYVMTQHDCQGRRAAEDPVGLAAYTMDSHNVQRYVRDGRVYNEGDVQVGGFPPYPISYRAIVPRREECTNLLVPVCLSASHIAFGSIRMEPVFMVLGQSAATAASQAIDAGVDVQGIDYDKLRKRLLADSQVLAWTAPRRAPGARPVDRAKLEGIVVDDDEAKLEGDWVRSVSVSPFVHRGYRHDNNEGKGRKSATFVPELERAGLYEVRLAYTPHANRAPSVSVTIHGAGAPTVRRVDQRRRPPLKNGFISLGRFRLTAAGKARVVVSNAGTEGYVVVDAVQFIEVR